MAQTAAKPLHADRVVVLKKERMLQLLTGGRSSNLIGWRWVEIR